MSDSQPTCLLYGCYGYTAQLILKHPSFAKINWLLAGRDEKKTKALAEENGIPWLSFSTGEASQALREAKKKYGVQVLLNCAGPFAETFGPLAETCLSAGIHYTDITGELEVFEHAASLDKRAKQAGIMIMPGTGFDVVPTDCMAAWLAHLLPDATAIRLGFFSTGGVSKGTATTAAQNLGRGGAVRKNGKIQKVPTAWKTMEINFGERIAAAATIPWGDVATAWYSTGVGDIEVYMAMKPSAIRWAKFSNLVNPLLRSSFFQQFLKNKIRQNITGPTDKMLTRTYTLVWGEAENASGKMVEKRIKTPNGYALTADASILIVEKILAGNFRPGFATPSLAYGKELIFECAGVEEIN